MATTEIMDTVATTAEEIVTNVAEETVVKHPSFLKNCGKAAGFVLAGALLDRIVIQPTVRFARKKLAAHKANKAKNVEIVRLEVPDDIMEDLEEIDDSDE